MLKKMVVVATLLSVVAFSAAWAETLNIGSSNPGSITHSTSTAIAKLVTMQLKIQTRVQPHGGQSAFIPAVNANEVQFGCSNAYELVDALGGTGIYDGRKQANLRAVAVLMPLRNAFWVAKDSPIKSISDLKGKRVPGGWTSQKTIGDLASAMLANGGLTYDDVTMVKVPNVNGGADDFIQGKVDTFYFAIGSGKVREAGAKVGGLRALPMDPSPEAMARTQKYVPVQYAMLVKPSPANYGILEPTYIGAMDFVFVTNKDVPEDTIYKITKTIHGGKEDFMKSFKAFGANFTPDLMCKELPAGEYHPGAIKFYKEAGLWPPKK